MGATILCPHGGTVTPVPTNVRVRVGGAFALLVSDVFTVAGCPYFLSTPGGPVPTPCVTVTWSGAATKVKVNSIPVLLQSSSGSCYGAQGNHGSATIASVQMQVMGS